jgi:hypothetical protein
VSFNEKNSYQQKREIIGLRLLYLFVFLLAAAFLIHICTKNREYSERENRNLAQNPTITWEKITNGTFMSEYEEYISDQFAFRDICVVLRSAVGSVMGKSESNGVYKGKDGYLIQEFSEPSDENLKKQMNAIYDFSKEYPKITCYMAIVPNAVSVLADKLPANAPVYSQDSYLDEIEKELGDELTFIDVRETLKAHNEEYIYYKTDHHWTTLGAWYGYQKIAEEMNLKNGVNAEYEVLNVTNKFQGTLAATSGYGTYTYDSISVYSDTEQDLSTLVYYVEEQEKQSSLYVTSALEERDKYQVFLGGNHPLVEIDTNANSKKTLLIFKDSYANCVIPFLAHDYKKIVVVDPRYYYGDLKELISSKKIKEVLYLYNADTFSTDTSLTSLLTNALQ